MGKKDIKDLPKYVMKLDEYCVDKKWRKAQYRVACACENPECDVYVDFTWVEFHNELELEFYKDVHFIHYHWKDIIFWSDVFKEIKKRGFFYVIDHIVLIPVKNFWYRFKKALKLIFTGRLGMQETFSLKDTGHIQNFIDVLERGKQYCLEEEQKEKKENL